MHILLGFVVIIFLGSSAGAGPCKDFISQNIDPELALKGQYCIPERSRSTKDFFLPRHDVSAEFISLWDTEKIKHQYNNSNLSSFMDLNVEAVNVWQSMLTCSVGNADQARYLYSLDKWHDCPSVHERLVSLHVNVRNFFLTSPWFNVELNLNGSLDQTELCRRIAVLFRQSPSDLFKSVPKLPTIHPLALQIISELQSEVLIQKSSLKFFSEQQAYDMLKYYQNIGLTFHMLPNGKCSSLGLWPSVGRVLSKRSLLQAGQAINVEDDNGVEVSEPCNFANLPTEFQNKGKAFAQEFVNILKKYSR